MPPFRAMCTYETIARLSAHLRWTGESAVFFLKHLGEHGNAARAARAVGMSCKSASTPRARAPESAKAWAIALADARIMRETERHWRKAVHPLLDKRVRIPLARQDDRSA